MSQSAPKWTKSEITKAPVPARRIQVESKRKISHDLANTRNAGHASHRINNPLRANLFYKVLHPGMLVEVTPHGRLEAFLRGEVGTGSQSSMLLGETGTSLPGRGHGFTSRESMHQARCHSFAPQEYFYKVLHPGMFVEGTLAGYEWIPRGECAI